MEDKNLAPGTVEINIGGCSDKGYPVPVKSLTVNGRSIPFLMDSDFILRIRGGGPAAIQTTLYAERFITAPWSKE